MTRYLILTGALTAIMIPLGLGVHWLVYTALPAAAATHLGVALLCLAAGFLLGQRHGIER